MAVSDTRTRAPRGTKTLTQAFFSALAEIPEERRDEVAKAAQSAIREELLARRLKKSGRGMRATTRGAATRGAATRGAATKTNGPRRRATTATRGRRTRRTA